MEDGGFQEYKIPLPGSQAQRVKQIKQQQHSNQQDDGGGDNGAGAAPYDDGTGGEDGDAELRPLDVLLQFIPYYGQGDPSNDYIVRSALSSLSVEDIDSKDDYGNTLLLLACQYRCEDLARIMLNRGANPSAQNSSGSCCLHFACYKDTLSPTVAKALLQNGATAEVKETYSGLTPLMYAAQSGDTNICKLLLAHGAQINSTDFSNYTCIDYAKWENHHECAQFLEDRLSKFKMESMRSIGSMFGMGGMYGAPGFGGFGFPMTGMGTGMNGGMGGGMGMMGAPFMAPMMNGGFNAAEWQEYEDPDSQMKYYSNIRTGETMWETDFRAKASARPPPPSQPPSASTATSSPSDKLSGMVSSQSAPAVGMGMGSGPGSMGGIRHSFYAEHPVLKAEADLELEAFKLRVTVFFKKYAPTRIGEEASLLERYRGREFDLIRDLCKEFSVALDPELSAYHVTLKELQTEHLNKAGSVLRPGMSIGDALGAAVQQQQQQQQQPMMTPVMMSPSGAIPPSPSAAMMGITPKAMQAPGVDEAMVQAMVQDMRAKHEAQLEEERANFRKSLAEKEGALVNVQGELDTLRREKASLADAKAQLEDKVSRAQSQGGEALAKSEEEITKLQDANAAVKAELASVRQELSYAKEKLQSAENTLANMASGHEEQIAREKAAAEERAAQMREKEERHAQEIRDLEGAMKASEIRAKYEMAQAKGAWDKQEAEMRVTHEAARKALDEEVDALRRELTALKAKSAQELSAAQMEIDDLRKSGEDTLRRAEAAEEVCRALQAEVAEARAIQQYNAQLHKDLAREQQQRKRLHNEMEDMKGRIRVYVRIRPFSKKEKELGCTEAVTKDGKLSCLVRGANGPDSKKNYDFDQVFAGSEGNTQADVFKDTKHLMLSVIDGYNVCIFAYGQTGAGKSFTMIGAADIGDCLKENGEFDELAGITPRAVSELFRLLNERQAQVSTEVEVQMFQLYRDGLDDLLVGGLKKKRKDDAEDADRPTLKITLAEHSPTGLVQVEGACSMTAESPADVMRIFAKGTKPPANSRSSTWPGRNVSTSPARRARCSKKRKASTSRCPRWGASSPP